MAGYKISELESQADKKSWFIELDEPHEFHEYEDTFRTKYLIASYASSNDAPIDWPAEIILWNATKTKHLSNDISLSYGEAEETFPYEAFAINEHNLLSKEDIATGQKLAPEQLLHVALDWLETELGQKETLSKEAMSAQSTAQSAQPQEQPSQIDAANKQPTIPITNIENTTPSSPEQKTTTPAASTVSSEAMASHTDNGGNAAANPSTSSDDLSQDKVKLVFKSSDVRPFIEKNTGAQKAMCTMGDGYVVSLFMKTEHLLAQQAGQDVTFEFEPTQSIKMFGDLKHQNLPLQELNVKELRDSLIDRYAFELAAKRLELGDSKQTEPIQEHTEVKTESVAPSTDEQNFKLKIAELLISGADEQAIIDFVGNYASGLAINKQTNVVQETPKEETTEQTEETNEVEILSRFRNTYKLVDGEYEDFDIEDSVTFNPKTNKFIWREYVDGELRGPLEEITAEEALAFYLRNPFNSTKGELNDDWQHSEDAYDIIQKNLQKVDYGKELFHGYKAADVDDNRIIPESSTIFYNQETGKFTLIHEYDDKLIDPPEVITAERVNELIKRDPNGATQWEQPPFDYALVEPRSEDAYDIVRSALEKSDTVVAQATTKVEQLDDNLEKTEAPDPNDGKTAEKELLYRIQSTFTGGGEDKQINTIEDVVAYNETTNSFLLHSYINGDVLSEKELNLNQVNEIYKQSNGAPITGTNWESTGDTETILRRAEEKAAKQSAEDRPNPNVSANAMLEQMSTHKVQTSATAKQEEQGQTYKP